VKGRINKKINKKPTTQGVAIELSLPEKLFRL